MSVAVPYRAEQTLAAPAFLHRINALRKTDNVTNWFYLLREYLWLGAVVGLAIAFFHLREGWELSWWWNLPVSLVAVVLVGAGQHRLTTLGHEASHYLLFRNRLLNELVSDLLCMFPMWSSTHNYRIQHLAHHQYPNDPERDPDVAQMEASGHRFHFPMSPVAFVWECVIKQILWVVGLVRYVAVRAQYASIGGGSGPYQPKRPASRVVMGGAILYFLVLTAVMFAARQWGPAWLLISTPVVGLVGMLTFYALLPARTFGQLSIKPDVSPRLGMMLRVGYVTALITAIAWLTWLTGRPWAVYYGVLWVLPIATTFSFFMLMRQVVQHGNAGTGRFTNTRVFLVSPVIRFAVFPLGMDYHLPHHLFPLVPHYRLPELHRMLLETEEYRKNATVVEGYFFHRKPPEHVTVLELMAGPLAGGRNPD